MAIGCKMWYNLNENEPTAKFEFRFTHTGSLNEVKRSADRI